MIILHISRTSFTWIQTSLRFHPSISCGLEHTSFTLQARRVRPIWSTSRKVSASHRRLPHAWLQTEKRNTFNLKSQWSTIARNTIDVSVSCVAWRFASWHAIRSASKPLNWLQTDSNCEYGSSARFSHFRLTLQMSEWQVRSTLSGSVIQERASRAHGPDRHSSRLETPG